MITEENVILVDEFDNEIGVMEKMKAHHSGVLHRAFSVCLFNESGKWLLHKRAADKYHSPALWTNACCSHPRPGETVTEAAHRRLQEEMGMDCELSHRFSFRYRVDLDNGLTEHEFDHVLVGRTNALPVPDPAEVSDWQYITTEQLQKEMQQHPEQFTEWFRLIFPKLAGKNNL